MALFNRSNKNKTEVPAEIQEYYQAEKRDRTGIAWLLAFGTLVVTILLAAGIFFAGRWAYRKIAGSDGQNNVSQTDQSQSESQQEDQQSEDGSQTKEEKRAEEERQQAEREAQEAEEQRAEQEREREAREEAERRENTQAPTELPAGDDSADDRHVASNRGNIPETGPGDTLAIFIAVSILGYMAHRVHFAQKTK